jgi:hypothetical protein
LASAPPEERNGGGQRPARGGDAATRTTQRAYMSASVLPIPGGLGSSSADTALQEKPGHSFPRLRGVDTGGAASRALHQAAILAPATPDSSQPLPRNAIQGPEGVPTGTKGGQSPEVQDEAPSALDYVFLAVTAAFVIVLCISIVCSCCWGNGALLLQNGTDGGSLAMQQLDTQESM